MSNSSRYDLHTDRSIQLDSEVDSPLHEPIQINYESIYYQKMEAHLIFMEKEFKRNMEWQMHMINELKKEKKNSVSSPKKANQNLALHLKRNEEQRLKEVLKDYCFISHDHLDLNDLIKLAINFQKKSSFHQRCQAQKENEVQFPLVPRVITMNDLAPSTRRHLDSSRVTPIKLAQSRIKLPKYRKAAKTPHQLFSPELQEPIKLSTKYRVCDQLMINQLSFKADKQIFLQDSLEKRLLNIEANNFVTFRQYLNDSVKIKRSQNVSLNFSSSHQESHSLESARSEKESLLLISENQQRQQNPSIYLKLQMKKQQQVNNNLEKEENKYYKQKQFLCFDETKKRKTGRIKQKIIKHPLYSPVSDSQPRIHIKRLHDSFGKIYHEFQQEKMLKEEAAILKPSHQHDRETLQSDG